MRDLLGESTPSIDLSHCIICHTNTIDVGGKREMRLTVMGNDYHCQGSSHVLTWILNNLGKVMLEANGDKTSQLTLCYLDLEEHAEVTKWIRAGAAED